MPQATATDALIRVAPAVALRVWSRLWDLTLAGDYHAAEVVLKIVGRRCTIMGFDPPGDTDLTPPRTVLVTGSSEQYVATLQSLIAETEDREAGR